MTTKERTDIIITHLNKVIIKIDLGLNKEAMSEGYFGDYHIKLKNNMYYYYTSYINDRFGVDYDSKVIENYMNNKYTNQKWSPT